MLLKQELVFEISARIAPGSSPESAMNPSSSRQYLPRKRPSFLSPINARNGFTLVELLVVLLIIATLLGLLFPAIMGIVRSSRATKCSSRMRQVGLAMLQYAQPRGGRLPRVTGHGDEIDESWMLDLAPYLGDVDEIRICPTDPEGEYRLDNHLTSYAMNGYMAVIEDLDGDHEGEHDDEGESGHDDEGHGHESHRHEHADGRFANVTKLRSPSTAIMLFEAAEGAHIDHVDSFEWFVDEHIENKGVFDAVSAEVAVQRHDGTANYLYADGHVETHDAESLMEWCRQGTVEKNFVLPSR